jgi:hypothetical protein
VVMDAVDFAIENPAGASFMNRRAASCHDRVSLYEGFAVIIEQLDVLDFGAGPQPVGAHAGFRFRREVGGGFPALIHPA